MKPHTDSRPTAQRCPVGVVYADGRIICYDQGKSGTLIARELGADVPTEISLSMRQAILADIEHQRAKRGD
jgi:hypothetical protein